MSKPYYRAKFTNDLLAAGPVCFSCIPSLTTYLLLQVSVFLALHLVKVKPHVMNELSSAVQSLGRHCTALRRFPLTLVHPVKDCDRNAHLPAKAIHVQSIKRPQVNELTEGTKENGMVRNYYVYTRLTRSFCPFTAYGANFILSSTFNQQSLLLCCR